MVRVDIEELGIVVVVILISCDGLPAIEFCFVISSRLNLSTTQKYPANSNASTVVSKLVDVNRKSKVSSFCLFLIRIYV